MFQTTKQFCILRVSKSELKPSLPILDTLQKNKFLLVSRYSHEYQKTKGLKYPCKIDLAMFDLICEASLKQDSVRRQTFSQDV